MKNSGVGGAGRALGGQLGTGWGCGDPWGVLKVLMGSNLSRSVTSLEDWLGMEGQLGTGWCWKSVMKCSNLSRSATNLEGF